jgi:FAD/FMN-containing dehydrogenase
MSDLAWLGEAVRGPALFPGSDGFEAAARAWNVAVPQQPDAVVQVADTEDVAALVRAARDAGVVLAAQLGGHTATGAVDGTVLVRTGALDSIEVDPEAARARVGTGVKWGQLHQELAGSGLIGMGGSNPDVSMAGLILGGGMSWFSRRHGIAATRLVGAEIVDGAGVPRWVDDTGDPDLMWALRGGGGEFGLVTALEVELMREPELHGGSLVFAMADAAGVLAAFREVTATADERLTCWASLFHVPDLPFLPAEVRGQSLASILLTHLGPIDEIAEPLARLRAAGTLLMDSVRPLTIDQLGSVADEPTDPTPFSDWATTVRELDEATCERILEQFADRAGTALTSVEIRHLGGAFATPARPGACDRLDGEYCIGGLGLLMAPEQDPAIHACLTALAGAIADADLDRVTPSFLSAGDPITRAFDDGTIGRLRQVKQRVDPNGLFRSDHPLDGSRTSGQDLPDVGAGAG